MKKAITALGCALLLFLPGSNGQKADTYPQQGGIFQLGMRTTSNLFSEAGYNGLGVGGQFRISLGKRLNTEWFADLINTNLANLGKRVDAHIGWSVMFYPWTTPRLIKPYLIAGHCFDYTHVTPYSKLYENNSNNTLERWSSATQAGLGTHFLISPMADISISAQYMIHLGRAVHTDIEEINGVQVLHVEEHAKGELGLEGHLLLTVSLNFRIAQLWKPRG
jgi:hypothetical protein